MRFQCPKCGNNTLEAVESHLPRLECDNCSTIWLEFVNCDVITEKVFK